MPSGEDAGEGDVPNPDNGALDNDALADSTSLNDAFQIVHDEDGNIVVTISFKGQRFAGGRLPIAALPTLAKMERLLNAVTSDVDHDLNDRQRTSKHAKVELVLTGEIDDGSARLTALVLPLILAVSPAAKVSQQVTIAEAVRRAPIVATQLAASEDLSYPTSPKTIELVRDLSADIQPGESLVLDVAERSPGVVDGGSSTGEAEFTHDLGESLRTQLAVSEEASFFVTGTLRNLEDRGEDDGHMTLFTGSGQFRVPATAQHRQTAARMYAEARSVIFAVSGRGRIDGAGRMREVTHLSEVTAVDRMFEMERRLEELRGLADDPEDAVLAARIGRAATSLPTIVHHTGLAPALFLTDDNEIEARWIVDGKVANVTFGSDVEVYIFDRETEELVLDLVLDDDAEILPAWPIVDAINEHLGGSDSE